MTSVADQAALHIAARQDGVISRAQATAAGLTARQIRLRYVTGMWQRLAPNLFLMSAAPVSRRQRIRAALLAVPGSAASHQTASELWGMEAPRRRGVEVTAPWGCGHRSGLAVVHRSRRFSAADIVVLDGLRLTSRSRTVIDLAGRLSASRLAGLVDDQLAARLLSLDELGAALRRIGHRRAGISTLARILDERAPGFVAPESELEAAFLLVVERYGLPPPVRQFAAPWLSHDRGRVDFAYPAARLLVEVDGRRWHSRDQAARRDRRRDRQAQLAGWVVLRYGYDEVTTTAEEVATEIRQVLLRGAATPAA